MSGNTESPFDANDNEASVGMVETENGNEVENDVYAQLAQKERDLILAAELGKALLDSNQELQARYDQTVDDYIRKIEILEQEKHDLHLEVEKVQTEYQNAMKELQDDVTTLRKQIRTSDEHKVTERERSRSLREAQQNSEYLLEQFKTTKSREEELLHELNEQRQKNKSAAATIQDQLDHIAMLREQVEYLSEKLRETNQKLLEAQGEKETLVSTLDITQEKLQTLEITVSQQDEKIHRQACDIEELQESNSDLQQQLQAQRLHQHHKFRPLIVNTSISTSHNKNNSSTHPPNTLYFELCQEQRKTHQQHHGPHPIQAQQHELSGSISKSTLGHNDSIENSEKSVSAELDTSSASQEKNASSSSSLMTEFSSSFHHRRNISDCSISSTTEGSRKRHHQNIGSDGEDSSEEGGDKSRRGSSNKQTLYSELSSHRRLNRSGYDSIDSNGNQVPTTDSSKSDFQSASPQKKRDTNEHSLSVELFQASAPGLTRISPDGSVFHDSPSFSNTYPPYEVSQEQSLYEELSHFEEESTYYIGDDNQNKSLFSELSPFAQEFYPRHQEPQEQSLFSELSSQLFDDKNGVGSDSSSGCMMGVFDFDSQEGDRSSNESLNHSMELRSRMESDMSHVSDWYHMTPVTSEMLEDDDFECDDDDFLVGNIAGSTLSITSAETVALPYSYNYFTTTSRLDTEVCAITENEETPETAGPEGGGCDKQQEQLSEACNQMRELVAKVQTISKPPKTSDSQNKESGADTTENLLSLIEQMRLCVENLMAGKEQEIQNTDVSSCTGSQTDKRTQHSISDKTEEEKLSLGVEPQLRSESMSTREEAEKYLRKCKSSSSLKLL